MLETIRTQIDHDTILSDLRSTIIKGLPVNRRIETPCIRHYWAMRDLLSQSFRTLGKLSTTTSAVVA